jgi:hypothetical protein
LQPKEKEEKTRRRRRKEGRKKERKETGKKKKKEGGDGGSMELRGTIVVSFEFTEASPSNLPSPIGWEVCEV